MKASESRIQQESSYRDLLLKSLSIIESLTRNRKCLVWTNNGSIFRDNFYYGNEDKFLLAPVERCVCRNCIAYRLYDEIRVFLGEKI